MIILMKELVTLLLVGLSVGLGNFAAAVAIGLGGITKSVRYRVILVFGLFETLMPIVGLILGKQFATYLGGNANLIGGTLLGLTGAYIIISSLRKKRDEKITQSANNWGKLIIGGLALSIDNLIVGFSLGASNQPIILAVIIIGTASIGLAIVGLEIGNKLKSSAEEYSELLSGLILILIGLLIGIKVL